MQSQQLLSGNRVRSWQINTESHAHDNHTHTGEAKLTDWSDSVQSREAYRCVYGLTLFRALYQQRNWSFVNEPSFSLSLYIFVSRSLALRRNKPGGCFTANGKAGSRREMGKTRLSLAPHPCTESRDGMIYNHQGKACTRDAISQGWKIRVNCALPPGYMVVNRNNVQPSCYLAFHIHITCHCCADLSICIFMNTIDKLVCDAFKLLKLSDRKSSSNFDSRDLESRSTGKSLLESTTMLKFASF